MKPVEATASPADKPASSNVVPLKRAVSIRQNEREFLPAALEITETPASPVGRAIAFVLIAFFLGGFHIAAGTILSRALRDRRTNPRLAS